MYLFYWILFHVLSLKWAYAITNWILTKKENPI